MIEQQLKDLEALGLVPYVATSERYVDMLDLSVLGDNYLLKTLEDPEHRDFHLSYILSNAMAFGSANLQMPGWVYIDCVTMQTAVIGFALKFDQAPKSLQFYYQDDSRIQTRNLRYIPITGQIAGFGMDGKSMIGFSLFSLRRRLADMNIPEMATITKYLGLKVYRAEERGHFLGISQYNNKVLCKHALFGKKMYLDQAWMPVHTLDDITLVYDMIIDLDEERIFGPQKQEPEKYDFLLRYDDLDKKKEIQAKIREGHKFVIENPVHIRKDGVLYLPITQES